MYRLSGIRLVSILFTGLLKLGTPRTRSIFSAAFPEFAWTDVTFCFYPSGNALAAPILLSERTKKTNL